MVTALDVANYVIESSYTFKERYAKDKEACLDARMPMTNLRLQKILYYIQGEHYREYGTPLFEEDFYAWQYGPVVPEVYRAFSSYSFLALEPQKNYQKENLSEDTREFIDNIVNNYSSYSNMSLIDKTHNESPWKNTFSPYNEWKKIEKGAIKEYFINQLRGV